MLVTSHRRALHRGGVAVLLAAAALVLGGCGGGDTAGPERGIDVEDIQNDPAGAPEDFPDVRNYAGQQVTVSAEVSEILGPRSFIIADDAGEQLLVVYDGSPQLTVDTPVQVTGTVQRAFGIYEAEEFASGNLSDTAFSDFNGEPYIQAGTITTLTSHNEN